MMRKGKKSGDIRRVGGYGVVSLEGWVGFDEDE